VRCDAAASTTAELVRGWPVKPSRGNSWRPDLPPRPLVRLERRFLKPRLLKLRFDFKSSEQMVQRYLCPWKLSKAAIEQSAKRDPPEEEEEIRVRGRWKKNARGISRSIEQGEFSPVIGSRMPLSGGTGNGNRTRGQNAPRWKRASRTFVNPAHDVNSRTFARFLESKRGQMWPSNQSPHVI